MVKYTVTVFNSCIWCLFSYLVHVIASLKEEKEEIKQQFICALNRFKIYNDRCTVMTECLVMIRYGGHKEF